MGNKSPEQSTSLLPLNRGIKRMWWVWFCFWPLPKCKKAAPRELLKVHVTAYLLCPKITHLIYFWLCKFSSHYLCTILYNILITLLFQIPAQILLLFFPLHCPFLLINIWMSPLISNKNFNFLSYFTSDLPTAHLSGISCFLGNISSRSIAATYFICSFNSHAVTYAVVLVWSLFIKTFTDI